MTELRHDGDARYSLIGDIHGHADELVQLLTRRGYRQSRGVYRQAGRKVIFLGDFIDRGPKIREVLGVVRPMIEEGAALAVMGNHEWNALAYHTEDALAPGQFLRRRISKNERQHRATIEQLTPRELGAALDWFRTLPLWLDIGGPREAGEAGRAGGAGENAGLRVVHASVDTQIRQLIDTSKPAIN